MKRTQSIPVLALLFSVVWLTACATANQNAFRTIGMVQVSVREAMNGWRDYVATGKATKGDEDTVRQMWTRYQSALDVVDVAQKAYHQTKDISQLSESAVLLSAVAQDLTEFIYDFIPHPDAKKGKDK